jgi:hypothetical protein
MIKLAALILDLSAIVKLHIVVSCAGMGIFKALCAVQPSDSNIAANPLAATHMTERLLARRYEANPFAKIVLPHPADANNPNNLIS